MAISKKVTKYLDDNKYKYEIIPHRTTYTAWDTAQTEKVKPQEVGKALVLKIDQDWTVAVLPSNRNLDKKKLLKIINAQRLKAEREDVHPVKYPRSGYAKGVFNRVKKIEFAKEAWMKKNVPGKLGATPPFAGLLKNTIFADKLLLKNKKIYLGSGEYDASIRVSVSQYLKIEKPVQGSFSVKKC